MTVQSGRLSTSVARSLARLTSRQGNCVVSPSVAVSVDNHDKTWANHLDGFLAILRVQAQTENNSLFPTMQQALSITDGGRSTPASDQVVDSFNQITMQMGVTKLRLRQLVAEHDTIAQSWSEMGNIDLEKLRIGPKALYRDALLLTSSTVLGATSTNITDQNACRAVVVITASLLIRISFRLETKQPFQPTIAHSNLQKAIHEAVDATIYASTDRLFPDEANVMDVSCSNPQPLATTLTAIPAM